MVRTVAGPIEPDESQVLRDIEGQRSALAEAQREGAALRRRRDELLMIADVDTIEEIDKKGRRADIAAEIAAAKIKPLTHELERLRRERARWGGVEMPSDDQFAKLLAIVFATHRFVQKESAEVPDFVQQFKRALNAVSQLRRTDEVDVRRYFSAVVDDCNAILRTSGMSSVEGPAVLAAVIASGDVKWRKADPSLGVPLAVGLNQWRGVPSAASWRALLDGRPPLAPIPAPQHLVDAQEARSQVRFLPAGADGLR